MVWGAWRAKTWSWKESDSTEQLPHTHTHTHTQNCGKSLWLEWFCIVIGERYTQQILERTENKAL